MEKRGNKKIGKEHKFVVPYGGLVYAQSSADNLTLKLSGTVDAPWYKLSQDGTGDWINPINSPAPLGEVESKTFIYTAAKKNLNASNFVGGIKEFAEKMDIFSSDLDELYARDENSIGDKKIAPDAIPYAFVVIGKERTPRFLISSIVGSTT